MSTSRTDSLSLFNSYKTILTQFQRAIHTPNDDIKGDEVHSVFYSEFRKATWYSKHPEKLTTSNETNGEGEVIYRANTKYHGLTFTDISVDIPSIICKDGYTASWSPHLGTNILERMRIKFNDIVIQEMDQVYMDMHTEGLITSDERKIKKENMGDISLLKDWNIKLPGIPISFVLPTFYSETISKFFPLYFCGFLDRLDHCLKLRTKIEDLVLVKKDNVIEKASIDSIEKVGKNSMSLNITIPKPDIWGQYIYLPDFECDFNRQSASSASSKELFNQRNIFMVENVIDINGPNPTKLGKKHQTLIPDTGYPIHRICWVAQNQTSLSINNYSNYSTNFEDQKLGWDPIEYSTINFGKGNHVYEMPSFRTSRVYPSRELMATPEEKGYHYWSLSATKSTVNPPPGIRIINGELSVKLSDTNPFISHGDAIASNDDYMVHIRLCMYRMMRFKVFPKDENLRNSSHAEIEFFNND